MEYMNLDQLALLYAVIKSNQLSDVISELTCLQVRTMWIIYFKMILANLLQ